jgi:hypothetical protein
MLDTGTSGEERSVDVRGRRERGSEGMRGGRGEVTRLQMALEWRRE